MNINYTKPALKALRKLPPAISRQIREAIDKLAIDPINAKGSKKLQGTNDLYRIRIRQWRVIYTIEHDVLTITIVKIGSRGDVYKHC